MANACIHDIPLNVFLKYFFESGTINNQYRPISKQATCDSYYDITYTLKNNTNVVGYIKIKKSIDTYLDICNSTKEDISQINKLFSINIPTTLEFDSITRTSQKSNTSATLYMNPFQDNTIFGVCSTYEYAAIINDIVYPYVYLNNDTICLGNFFSTTNVSKMSVENEDLEISSDELYDSEYKLYYYPLIDTLTDKVIGRLYKLNTFNIIDKDSNGYKYTNILSSESDNVETFSDQLPMTPLQQYFDYMRSMKQDTSYKTTTDTNIFTDRGNGKIIYKRLGNRDIIGFEVAPTTLSTINPVPLPNDFAFTNTLVNIGSENDPIYIDKKISIPTTSVSYIIFDTKLLCGVDLSSFGINKDSSKIQIMKLFKAQPLFKDYCFFKSKDELLYINTKKQINNDNYTVGTLYDVMPIGMYLKTYIEKLSDTNNNLNLIVPHTPSYSVYSYTIKPNGTLSTTCTSLSTEYPIHIDPDINISASSFSNITTKDEIKELFQDNNLFDVTAVSFKNRITKTEIADGLEDSFKNIIRTSLSGSDKLLRNTISTTVFDLYLGAKGIFDLTQRVKSSENIVNHGVPYYNNKTEKIETGFIPLSELNIRCTYSKVNDGNGSTPNTESFNILSDVDKQIITNDIQNESYIDKLTHYKLYNSNINELDTKIKEESNKRIYELMQHAPIDNSVHTLNVSKTKTDTLATQSVEDIKHKLIDFYLAYIKDTNINVPADFKDEIRKKYNTMHSTYYNDKVIDSNNVFQVENAVDNDMVRYYFSNDAELSKKMFVYALKDKLGITD